MPTEKLGIDNLKVIASGVASLANAFGKAAEDKKFNWRDLFYFAKPLKSLAGLPAAWPKAKPEMADMDPGEKEALLAFIRTEFDIPQEAAEALGEKMLETAFKLLEIYKILK